MYRFLKICLQRCQIIFLIDDPIWLSAYAVKAEADFSLVPLYSFYKCFDVFWLDKTYHCRYFCNAINISWLQFKLSDIVSPRYTRFVFFWFKFTWFELHHLCLHLLDSYLCSPGYWFYVLATNYPTVCPTSSANNTTTHHQLYCIQ